MELVGFTFIETQEEFEKWQKENAGFSVRSVHPHLLEMGMEGYEKYGPSYRGSTKWGVFVMYVYSA